MERVKYGKISISKAIHWTVGMETFWLMDYDPKYKISKVKYPRQYKINILGKISKAIKDKISKVKYTRQFTGSDGDWQITFRW